MEEEKKNNKGLKVGIIIFLVMCLIAAIYFIFKNVYVGPNNTPSEPKETEINDTSEENNEVEFTELTKYELKEGEEKEVIVNGETIYLKSKEGKNYINEKEVDGKYFYVTNQFIITAQGGGQFGRETYQMYQFNGEKISFDLEKDIVYENLRIESDKLLADGLVIQYAFDWINLGNLTTTPCETKNTKKLSEYPDIINEYKNKETEATYSFTYKNGSVGISVEKVIKNLSYIEENANEICVQENS